MRNAGLDKAQAGIKIARRNINNIRYANHVSYKDRMEKIYLHPKSINQYNNPSIHCQRNGVRTQQFSRQYLG